MWTSTAAAREFDLELVHAREAPRIGAHSPRIGSCCKIWPDTPVLRSKVRQKCQRRQVLVDPGRASVRQPASVVTGCPAPDNTLGVKPMQRVLFAFILTTGMHASAAPAGVGCPAGTVPNGEKTPDVAEAWCEKTLDRRNVMHGPYRAWYPNGRLGTSGQYANGEPIGKWSNWYPSGRLQAFEWFEEGKAVRVQYWDEMGKPASAPAQ